MPKIAVMPASLKGFVQHGVDLQDGGAGQWHADCPFCGKERKFVADAAEGRWQCWVCGAKGNPLSFLRQLWDVAGQEGPWRDELAADRRLLDPATLSAWGVRCSPLTDEPLIPGWGVDGKLNQLCIYRESTAEDGRRVRKVWSTSGVWEEGRALWPFGVPAADGIIDAAAETVYVSEGCWDGMALWETLQRSPHGDRAAVIAVPGANVWREEWGTPLAGKRVVLCLDNDHPREVKGRQVRGAGLAGSQRIAAALAGQRNPPAEVCWVRWGDKGWTERLPSGYDVRDWLTEEDA